MFRLLAERSRRMANAARASSAATVLAGAMLCAPLAGCFTLDVPNPSFAVPRDEIAAEYRRLRETPQPLERPVVVLNGYRGTHLRGLNLGSDIARLTSQNRDDVMVVSYPLASNIPSVSQRVVDAINQRWPSDDPSRTIEVDVIGFSMGGLVARHAALPLGSSGLERRLVARRIFTLGTPHRGARAAVLAVDNAVAQMMPGAVFLSELDSALDGAEYELIPYAHTNDRIVGARNAAPLGRDPIWTAGTATFSHFTITTDKRVLVDMARRLRGERPWAEPSEPPTN
ncbi:MAG: hypothetical protein KDA05_04890 [Phycisphaerales bacterium]|nr:hypothetical protein [Phycisphaerales bacterium]